MGEVERARERMVALQIAGRGIADRHVLEAMRMVPRHAFVPPHLQESAYKDSPLPIGQGQTISQPYIVALMIEAAGVAPGQRILEVGAGSGYAAAVMSRVAEQVHAIEWHAALGQEAQARFRELGYDNIELRIGDGSGGWPEAAPFDAIIVSAGALSTPRALKDQLAVGGRLVIPVGQDQREQRLLTITRTGPSRFEKTEITRVRFVPLLGGAAGPE